MRGMRQSELTQVEEWLYRYTSLEGSCRFFSKLGYPVLMPPVPWDIGDLPKGVRSVISSLHQVVDLASSFRIFHVELSSGVIRRTDIRRFLETFYRYWPQGENLFVF